MYHHHFWCNCGCVSTFCEKQGMNPAVSFGTQVFCFVFSLISLSQVGSFSKVGGGHQLLDGGKDPKKKPNFLVV